MQVTLAIALLAGCNQVYGLDATQLRDGAGPDAPYRCTAQAPSLRGTPVPVLVGGEYARTYSISLDRRIAIANYIGGIMEGPGDSSMMKSALLMPPPPTTIGSPRLAPEGDELFVRYAETGTSAIVRYAREGAIWVQKANVLTVPGVQADLSIPTRRDAGPRRMVVTVAGDLREYVEQAPDQWMLAETYTPAQLGVMTIQMPNLTADGLRLVFQGQGLADAALLYASRDTVGTRFGTAVEANPFFGNPRLYDPYLLEDCSRMYFFVIADPSGVFYVEP